MLNPPVELQASIWMLFGSVSVLGNLNHIASENASLGSAKLSWVWTAES